MMLMGALVEVQGLFNGLSLAPDPSPPPAPHPRFPTPLAPALRSRTPCTSKVSQQSLAMFRTLPLGPIVLSALQKLSPCLPNVAPSLQIGLQKFPG